MLEVHDLHLMLGMRSVVKGVSLRAATGEVLTVLGPSGSGKTSVLRCIARLQQPSAGTLSFSGQLLEALPAYNTGFVAQGLQLFSHLTVMENVMLAAVKVRAMLQAEARMQALQLLDELSLAHRLHAYPCQMSGEEQQRVSIARALIMNPSILLLDKPTLALEPERVSMLVQLIRTLTTKARAIVLTTHDMQFAKAISDHVVFLMQGQVIERAPAIRFFARPTTPQARAFLKGCLAS